MVGGDALGTGFKEEHDRWSHCSPMMLNENFLADGGLLDNI